MRSIDKDTKPSTSSNLPDELPRFVAPTHGGVDILKLLTELEDLVENTPKMLGALLRFDEDRFHMTVMKIRANLPEEMKRASKLARDSERIVEETRENAERVVGDARKVAMQEMERGKSEAARLWEESQNELKRLRNETVVEQQRSLEGAQREAEHVQAVARQMASEIIADAQSRAEQLVADNAIVVQSQALAEEIRYRADAEADAIRRGADEYAKDLLVNLENVLSRAINQVQRGQDMLGGTQAG